MIGKVHGALTYLSIARNKGEKEVHTISCNHTIWCIRSCSIRRESYKEANLTRISLALMSQLKLCFRYRFYYFLTPWCLVPWLSLPIPRLFCLCLYDLGSFWILSAFLQGWLSSSFRPGQALGCLSRFGLGRCAPATSWQSRLLGKPPPVATVWGVRGCCPVANSKGLKFDAELFGC